MLSLAVAIGFLVSELLLLTIFIGLGLWVSAAAMTHAGVGTSPLWSVDEARRALGGSMIFMILSGYFLTVVITLACFRSRLLSLPHAAWVTLLFVLHAAFFFLYLWGPAVLSSSLLIVAVGVASVITAAVVQYFLWRTWLLPTKSS